MATHFSSKQPNQTSNREKQKKVLDELKDEYCKLVNEKNSYDVLDEIDVMKDDEKDND